MLACGRRRMFWQGVAAAALLCSAFALVEAPVVTAPAPSLADQVLGSLAGLLPHAVVWRAHAAQTALLESSRAVSSWASTHAADARRRARLLAAPLRGSQAARFTRRAASAARPLSRLARGAAARLSPCRPRAALPAPPPAILRARAVAYLAAAAARAAPRSPAATAAAAALGLAAAAGLVAAALAAGAWLFLGDVEDAPPRGDGSGAPASEDSASEEHTRERVEQLAAQLRRAERQRDAAAARLAELEADRAAASNRQARARCADCKRKFYLQSMVSCS
jgi:hypothetical protein